MQVSVQGTKLLAHLHPGSHLVGFDLQELQAQVTGQIALSPFVPRA
jgi:hypothetical protein